MAKLVLSNKNLNPQSFSITITWTFCGLDAGCEEEDLKVARDRALRDAPSPEVRHDLMDLYRRDEIARRNGEHLIVEVRGTPAEPRFVPRVEATFPS